MAKINIIDEGMVVTLSRKDLDRTFDLDYVRDGKDFKERITLRALIFRFLPRDPDVEEILPLAEEVPPERVGRSVGPLVESVENMFVGQPTDLKYGVDRTL